MTDVKTEVREWLKSKNYENGISLLSKYSKNKTLIRFLSRNQTATKEDKLLYELMKLGGLKEGYAKKSGLIAVDKAGRVPVVKQHSIEVKSPASFTGTRSISKLPKPVPFNKLPLIVQEVIKQKGDLYRKREVLHTNFGSVPENNEPQNIAIRASIASKIDHISKRIDVLFKAESGFIDKGIIPAEDILIWSEEPEAESEVIISDFKDLSDLQLRQKLTNLRTYTTKNDNLLLYQNKADNSEENPMPSGPKRDALEKKNSKMKSQIEEILTIQNNRASQS